MYVWMMIGVGVGKGAGSTRVVHRVVLVKDTARDSLKRPALEIYVF